MPLFTTGYTQNDLSQSHNQGYRNGQTAALSHILRELERCLPGQTDALGLFPVTPNELATRIVTRLTEAQAARNEVAWLQRWEAELRADPLLTQVQRLRQELKDEQAQCTELTRDLARTQKLLREERAARLAEVGVRDQRIADLNRLLARAALEAAGETVDDEK